MKRTNRLMLVIGVALAALSFVAVLALGGLGQQQAPPQAVEVPVVVAAADLPLGTQVTADNLATTTMPETEALDAYQNPDDVIGRVVRRAVSSGSVLTTTDFETSVSVPELVRSLEPGMRAIAVPLSVVNSVGALLQPGDYVDVLISLEETDMINPIVIDNPNAAQAGIDGTLQPPYISIDDLINNTSVKVVVQNVQVVASITPVIATDQGNGQGDTANQQNIIVLLAVTPQQAEIVRFAQLDGNISLVLRAPADNSAGDVQTSGITLKELVEKWGVIPPGVVKQ